MCNSCEFAEANPTLHSSFTENRYLHLKCELQHLNQHLPRFNFDRVNREWAGGRSLGNCTVRIKLGVVAGADKTVVCSLPSKGTPIMCAGRVYRDELLSISGVPNHKDRFGQTVFYEQLAVLVELCQGAYRGKCTRGNRTG